MCVRTLGFVLVLFPGLLQAQGCDPPRLVHGNFLPRQETYSDRTTITYSCDNGYKPVVEGWWATSTCERGKWSHEPQCIDESSCLPPTIPNGKYPKNSKGWYEDGSTLTITCDGGFEHQNQFTTITCGNGKWSSAPVCERSMSACSAPPKIPHAVIIHGYQEVFAAGSEVQYECEDGYTAHTKKSVCIQRNWTPVPTCRSSNERDTRLRYTTIQNCGNFPVIENAVAQQTSQYHLTYRCQRLYRLVGPETVRCISSGMWSNLPECRANFCAVNTDDNPAYKSVGIVHIENGEEEKVECVKPHSWSFEHYSKVRCINGRVEATECCNRAEHAVQECKAQL
ncbi:complement factor H-like isoform X2 [Simochromis diagramma]|uniref:complement factor H-like isoform X2 n=1 Tax=Simochromis diagramma TaxID=43689 RepID=UPI001A7E349B|nr:complement factor H-like isoform X2 [Simochromis diagramma]